MGLGLDYLMDCISRLENRMLILDRLEFAMYREILTWRANVDLLDSELSSAP